MQLLHVPAKGVAALVRAQGCSDSGDAGGNVEQLKQIIARYRNSLYPDKVTIDVEAAERVVTAEDAANVVKRQQVNLKTLLDIAVLAG